MNSKIAWLAGLLDGEGSIGIARCGQSLKPLVQMSSTSKETIDEAIRVLQDCGIVGIGYSYQERDPVNHQDAHYLRVGRIGEIDKLGNLMLAYSITKRRHWAVMLTFTTSRIQRWGIDQRGRLNRGGSPLSQSHPYTAAEAECYHTLHALNLRGAARKAANHA